MMELYMMWNQMMVIGGLDFFVVVVLSADPEISGGFILVKFGVFQAQYLQGTMR
jgi:hypothetical protein